MRQLKILLTMGVCCFGSEVQAMEPTEARTLTEVVMQALAPTESLSLTPLPTQEMDTLHDADLLSNEELQTLDWATFAMAAFAMVWLLPLWR